MPFGTAKVALMGSGAGGVEPFVAWYSYDDEASLYTYSGCFERADDDDNFFIAGSTMKTASSSAIWCYQLKVDKNGEMVSSNTTTIDNRGTGGASSQLVNTGSTYGWWTGDNWTNSSGWSYIACCRWDDDFASSNGSATSGVRYQRGGYPYTSITGHDYLHYGRDGLRAITGGSNDPPILVQVSYAYDSYANYRWETSYTFIDRTNSLDTLIRGAHTTYNQQFYAGGVAPYDTSDIIISGVAQGSPGYTPHVARVTDAASVYGNIFKMYSTNSNYSAANYFKVLGEQGSTDWYMQIHDNGSDGYDVSLLKMSNFPTSYSSNFTYSWKKAWRPASSRTDYYPVQPANPIKDSSGNTYQMLAFYNTNDSNKRELFILKRNSSGTVQWVNRIKWNSSAGTNVHDFSYPELALNAAEDMVYFSTSVPTLYPQPGYRSRALLFCLNADGSTSGSARFDDNWHFDIDEYTGGVDETSTWTDAGAGLNLNAGFSANSYKNDATTTAPGSSGNTYEQAQVNIA
tara:strand:+ start:89 stop:1633 length:1545 start_codon:yes stop_codon:yes gene_type:complete